ncbi:MAG: FtsK/SpoIIIE domain-containing protein [Acidimicrobiia bacterium]
MSRVVHRTAGGDEHDVVLEVVGRAATVAELARALAGAEPGRDLGLLVDGRWVAPATPAPDAGILDGSSVEVVAAAGKAPPAQVSAGWRVDVVGGLAAGASHRIGPGCWVVGRAPSSDVTVDEPTLSRRHAVVMVSPSGALAVADLGSRNGTRLDGHPVGPGVAVGPGAVLRLGAVEVTVRPQRTDDRPSPALPSPAPAALTPDDRAGTRPFRRPPPPAPIAGPRPLPVPTAPSPRPPRLPFSVVGVVVPLAMAALMVWVMGNVLFALFALLAPVSAVGGALEQRRRGRTATRRDGARFAAELASFGDCLEAAADDERRRRSFAWPDAAEVLRRATLPSVRMWERRPGHADFLRLRVGTGDDPAAPPLEEPAGPRPGPVDAVVRRRGRLTSVPVAVDLGAGGVCGIAGERSPALALARSLVGQVAVHHGPADVELTVLCEEGRSAAWDFVKWLPHATDDAGIPRVVVGQDRCAGAAEALLAAPAAAPGPAAAAALLVIDDDRLHDDRLVLEALRRPGIAGIVLAADGDRLPSSCTDVVELHGRDGEASVRGRTNPEGLARVLVAGYGQCRARTLARALARWRDPERAGPGSGLPSMVRLVDLLGLEGEPDLAAAVGRRWASAGADPPLRAPVGAAVGRPFVLDLSGDGPHALVAGTTGSGKSELLRTLVAGLATEMSPGQLTFVLVDFKGGSAFDACGRLPHTVGLVTDLDEDLADRALRCLEAEVRHRERRLREAGVRDASELRRQASPGDAPMPRLVVVVDEFATLRADVPGFVDSLVSIAQRGRSLGLHLVLATQRPAGAVSESIRTNTNLRVCLRVQHPADSTDVLGVAAAADLPRRRPGRALVRLGAGEMVEVQAALATGPAPASGPAVRVTPFGLSPATVAGDEGPAELDVTAGDIERVDSQGEDEGADHDLATLVSGCRAAFALSGAPPPRRPWTDPLPAAVDLDSIIDAGAAHDDDGLAAFTLADDPDHQRRLLGGWRLGAGNLLVVGIPGSGASTALAAAGLALARRHLPDRLHLYVVSFGAGELAPLAHLPHVGAVIESGQRERQVRLVRFLQAEMSRRRRLGPDDAGDRPSIVVLLDGYAGFAAQFSDLPGLAVVDAFAQVFAGGPDVGIHVAVAADRPGAVPAALTALVQQRLVLRLADPTDYAAFGLGRRRPGRAGAGRGIEAPSGLMVQVGWPDGGIAGGAQRVAASAPPVSVAPPPIGSLPAAVRRQDIAVNAQVGERPWSLPIGIGERDLAPRGLVVHAGEGALIAGPARSGRSTALAAVIASFRAACPDGKGGLVAVVAGERSPLSVELDRWGPAGAAAAVEAVRSHPGPALLVVDDAETVDDPGGALAGLVATLPATVALVVAGRSEVLRTAYQHWCRGLRRHRLGMLLQPDADFDGELVGHALPRRAPVPLTPGRGWLVVDGDAEVVQVASEP